MSFIDVTKLESQEIVDKWLSSFSSNVSQEILIEYVFNIVISYGISLRGVMYLVLVMMKQEMLLIILSMMMQLYFLMDILKTNFLQLRM